MRGVCVSLCVSVCVSAIYLKSLVKVIITWTMCVNLCGPGCMYGACESSWFTQYRNVWTRPLERKLLSLILYLQCVTFTNVSL